ncbi:THO complex subunit 2, partial [Lecanoromycetidae sp. Uapishka_2]
MAPGAGGKRKRPDRTFSQEGRDDGSRASPHRPQNLNLGQQGNQQQGQQSHIYGREQYDRGGGRRRASRGGRGGGSQRSPMNSPNAIPLQSRSGTANSQPMSPSLPPPRPLISSKQDASQQPAAATTAATHTPELKPNKLVPYDYEYATDEKIAVWTDSGRQDIVDTGTKARSREDALTLGVLFQELVRSGIDSRLEAAEAGMVVRDILGGMTDAATNPDAMVDEVGFDPSSLFLDCLSIFAEASTPAPALRNLVLATEISALKMRHELESPLLESLGMIRSTFVRVGIRQQTNLLYRQSNYNLLREETEGYSKLLTELFTTSNNEPPTSEVVEDTFERVKGMIGAFDLDVGRVLDITLDVFAAVLVKQYRFFVRYLRVSSWWPQDTLRKTQINESGSGSLPRWALPGSSGRPTTEEEKEAVAAVKAHTDEAFWRRTREVGMAAFFEIGGRRTEDSELTAAQNGNSTNLSPDDEDRKWMEITKTLPPPGNKVAAQVLGFKLRFYSSSARDPIDVLPVNLIYLAALLIKVGFISLRDLYPHIWPADPAMEGVQEEKMKEKAEREKLNRPGGGAMNALLAAGALPDDTVDGKSREVARLREVDGSRKAAAKADLAADRSTPTAQPEEKMEELPEPSEQKVQLLKSLLCIGALPEALYMLGRFPWLPDAFPELPEYIHRILHHSLAQVYEPLRPLKDQISLRAQQKVSDQDFPTLPKGEVKVKLIDAPPRRTMRWAQLDKEDTNEAIDYKFYWDDWADNVPVCHDVDDVFTLCSTLLNYTGVKIGQDTALLLKLARIGKYSLGTDDSESNKLRWVDLSKRLLVPALSLTRCNPGVVNEIWELIEKFPTQTRFSIYAEWYQGQISRLPDIKSAFDQARAETKDVLKRISKTTIKPMARALAKVAYASPGVVFQVAIAQLESYENIVDAVVECARYFTYLAYDVLIWSLMSSLGGTGRNRVQADGMLTSKWLAALSLFAGKVFKRYSFMNPTPIVQYVADQLRRGNSTDLIVLEEITKSMAGIISDSNFNEAQIIAMGNGELLQAQTMLQLLDRRHESKATGKRLMKSLTESRLAGQVLILIAQERQTGIFKIEEQNAHPKLLGNLFDQLHRILVQYTELLRSNLSVKEFDAYVPGVSELVNEFGLNPSIAFWISRPSIVSAMVEYDSKHGKRNSETKKSPTKEIADSALKSEAKASAEEATSEVVEAATNDAMDVTVSVVNTSPSVQNGVLDTKNEGDDSQTAITPPPLKTDNVQQPWHPVLQEIMDAIRPALPDQIWEQLGLSFYVTFWQLSLKDLQVSLESYADEIKRLQKKILAISSDRSDISIAGTQKKDREKKALAELQDRLQTEQRDCVAAYMQSKHRLAKEKAHWFSDKYGRWDALNVALIEHCFFPRMVISPIDAMYAFKMMKTMHSSGTPQFRTMGFLDQFFREKRLASMIFLCSAKEAENLGRFLNEVLKDLSRWHADKQLFEKEAYGLKKDNHGYAKKILPDKTITAFFDFEDFRGVVLKWHRCLNNALKSCIASGEYMHVRNAINVLNGIHQHFPVVNWMGSSLVATVTDLSKTETREDLKVAATSLIGGLKRREKDWVLPQAFALAPTKSGISNTNGTRSTSARPSTPRPDGDLAKSLNPKAPDFHPSPLPTVNGVPKVAGTATEKTDTAEDGEIEDAKGPDVLATQAMTSNALQPTNAGLASSTGIRLQQTFVSSTTFPASQTSPSQDRLIIVCHQDRQTVDPLIIHETLDFQNAVGLENYPERGHPNDRHLDCSLIARNGPAKGYRVKGYNLLNEIGWIPAMAAKRLLQDGLALMIDSVGSLILGMEDRLSVTTDQNGLCMTGPIPNRIQFAATWAAKVMIDHNHPATPQTAIPSLKGTITHVLNVPQEDHRLHEMMTEGLKDLTGAGMIEDQMMDVDRLMILRVRTLPVSKNLMLQPAQGLVVQQIQGESQYGRLNSDNDIPSGPRLPNGNQPPSRGGRNVSAPQPQINTQLPPSNSQPQVPASPIQERQIPSGPSRGSPRKSAPFSQQPATTSAPSTPVVQTPETAGIHPDRLKALQGSGVISPEATSQPQGRVLRQPPPPVSTMPAPGPPRGPNNQLQSPIGPASNRGGPPTGPAISNDRNGRDKRFAGLQNVLQQVHQPNVLERSGQGASIRGRGGRANNLGKICLLEGRTELPLNSLRMSSMVEAEGEEVPGMVQEMESEDQADTEAIPLQKSKHIEAGNVQEVWMDPLREIIESSQVQLSPTLVALVDQREICRTGDRQETRGELDGMMDSTEIVIHEMVLREEMIEIEEMEAEVGGREAEVGMKSKGRGSSRTARDRGGDVANQRVTSKHRKGAGRWNALQVVLER